MEKKNSKQEKMEEKKSKQRKRTVFERNKFFATTSVAGFGLINSSNSRVETAIWYIVILVFFALTISSIVELTDEFNNQQPIATVRMKRWNGEIENVTIKLWMFNFPFLYDEFYDRYSPYPSRYNKSLSYDLDQVISNFNTTERLIGSDVTWPHVLLSLMAKYFSAMFEIETSGDSRSLWRFQSRKYYGFIKRFVDHCEQLNMTNKELIDKWFNQFMAMVLVDYRDETKYKDRIIPFQLYMIHRCMGECDMVLYFRLGRKIVLPFEMGFTTFYVNEILLDSGVFGENGTLDDVRNWRRKFSQRLKFNTGGTYSSYAFEIKTEQESEREVNAIYSFQSASENCSSITPIECINECHSKLVNDHCHCTPLFSFKSYGNFIPCTLDHYEKCEKRPTCDLKNIEDIEEIDKICPAQCNQQVLSFDHVLYDNPKAYMYEYMHFKLRWKLTSYPAFKEIRSMSLRSYLAKLGGEFNFWIGASVISAIHFIVYITKQLIYTFKKKTKTGTNLRHLIKVFRRNRNDQNKTMKLLTLGIRQHSTDYITRQKPEKLQEIQILAEQMEILKNDTKQQGRQIELQQEKASEEIKKIAEQVAVIQENMSQEIKKVTVQVADIQENVSQEIKKIGEQQQKMAEQMELLMKHFVKEQQPAEENISTIVE